MEVLRSIPDKYFDLACVDPPYGGGARGEDEQRPDGLKADEIKYSNAIDGRFGGRFKRYIIEPSTKPENRESCNNIKATRTGGQWAAKYGSNIAEWDIAPPKEYFDELARVSKHQIIWGGNYFGLPPTRCFIVWDKKNISENFTMAMCEYAWTSFNSNAKIYRGTPQGRSGEERFHPTQKGIELYEFCFKHFAKEGDKVLDSFLGSGSSRIAAYNMGLEFLGLEINPIYFKKSVERFEEHTSQLNLFLGGD